MKEMYNTELKQRYIDKREKEVVLPNGYLQLWFSRIAVFENENNKDVSNFSYYEILDMYKTFNLNSVEMLQVLNSILSSYTQWCLQQNLVVDSQNHFLEFKKNIFEECVNTIIIQKKVVSRKQVLEWVNEMKNPVDGFIFLALFEGIRGKLYNELLALKISDFYDGKAKLCTGREIEISNELYNIALETNESLEYYGDKKVITLSNDGYIIKNFPNVQNLTSETAASQRIKGRIQRNADFLGVGAYVSGNVIRESGKIDYINRKSKEKGLSSKEYLEQFKGEVENQFGCRIPSVTVYCDKYKEYLE